MHAECLYELTGCPTLACPVLPRDFVDGEGQPLDLSTPPAEGALLSPAILALRRTFLLPLVVGLMMCLSFVLTKGRFRFAELYLSVLVALPLALVTFPTAWAELWAARRPPDRARHGVLSLLSGLAGALGFVGGMVAAEVTNGVLHRAADLWPYAEEVLSKIAANEDFFGNFVIMGFVQFALLTWVRLEGLRLRWQLAVMAGAGGVTALVLGWLSSPSGLDMFQQSSLDETLRAFRFITLGISVVLPLLSWVGEAIRWPAWFPWLASPPTRRGK